MDAQIGKCLARLAPFLDLSRVAITGGVALDLQLETPLVRPRRSSEHRQDLDFVAAAPDVVSPRVLTDFLVSHYHLPHAGYPKFLVQLVDPETRVRVDFLPDVHSFLSEARSAPLAGIPIRVLAPCTILEHKIALLTAASTTHRVDAKHYSDAVALARYCNRSLPSVSEAVVGEADYSRNPNAACARCEASRSPAFPLADKRRILTLLGYV